MRAIALHEFGQPEVLRLVERPVPELRAHELLVRVMACGICGHDLLARRGLLRTPLPTTLGHEIAGVVSAVGDRVDGFVEGDRVALVQRRPCADCHACRDGRPNLCRSGFYGEGIDGGYADFVVASPANTVSLPDSIAFADGAILSCAVGTGIRALQRAGVRAGERVLVTGAGGGVGIHAIQFARHLGAEVFATTSTAQRESAIRDVGADHVLRSDLLESSLPDEVRARTGGRGVDVVLEIAGPPTFGRSLRALAPGGRLMLVGNVEPKDVDLPVGLAILKELSIQGSAHALPRDLRSAIAAVERGQVQPRVAAHYELGDVAKAHRAVEQRVGLGRHVLVM